MYNRTLPKLWLWVQMVANTVSVANLLLKEKFSKLKIAQQNHRLLCAFCRYFSWDLVVMYRSKYWSEGAICLIDSKAASCLETTSNPQVLLAGSNCIYTLPYATLYLLYTTHALSCERNSKQTTQHTKFLGAST